MAATHHRPKPKSDKKLPQSLLKTKDIPRAYLLIIPGILVIGIMTKLLVFGAGNSIGFEPEDANVSYPASVAGISGASNGNAVTFVAPSSGGGTITIPSPGTWTNVTGNLSSVNNCDEWSRLFTPPSSTKVYVSMSCNHGGTGIYLNNGGTTWAKQGTGNGSVDPNTMGQQMVFDPNNINNLWLSGIYGSGDTFASADGGTTFRSLGSAAAGDGHSDGIGVDLSGDDPTHQILIEGQHESRPNPQVFKTTTGGGAWRSISSNLPSNFIFTQSPYVINASTYLIGAFVSWGGGQSGIYRTTNGGTSWSKQSDLLTFGYAFPAGGVLYWTSTANGAHDINRSTDNGVTWTEVGSGLKTETQAIGLSDGRLVALADSANRLMLSSDRGSTWSQFGATIPCSAVSLAYSPGQDAFFASGGDCGNNVWRLK